MMTCRKLRLNVSGYDDGITRRCWTERNAPFSRDIDEAAKWARTVEGDVLPLPVLDVRRAAKYITMSGHTPRARARTDL